MADKKTKKPRRAVIVAGVRTPFVKAFGEFLKMDTIDLSVAAVGALLKRGIGLGVGILIALGVFMFLNRGPHIDSRRGAVDRNERRQYVRDELNVAWAGGPRGADRHDGPGIVGSRDHRGRSIR